MSSFTDEPKVQPNADETEWTLLEPFRYWLTKLNEGDVITVPAGFKTDFASVPRAFWTVLPPWGRYGKAAIVHDYLYANMGIVRISHDGEPERWGNFTRKESDDIFRDAMAVLGVSFIKRNIMWAAVRTFAGPCWESHRKRA